MIGKNSDEKFILVLEPAIEVLTELRLTILVPPVEHHVHTGENDVNV